MSLPKLLLFLIGSSSVRYITDTAAFTIHPSTTATPPSLLYYNNANGRRIGRSTIYPKFQTPTTTLLPLTTLASSTTSSSTDTRTIQILMSDTGGGHRASANALRDALDELYPSDGIQRVECDIVDIYTEYGPFWPFDSFVAIYRVFQAYPALWELGFWTAASPVGLAFNELLLELVCFEPFRECMERPIGSTSHRADMVVSVHPLTQDIPLRILNYLDSNGKSREEGRTTPFATVVTDLGSAHPTWFNPGVDRCFVPSDALIRAAEDRDLTTNQLTKHGLPIRKGFWASTTAAATTTTAADDTDSTPDNNILDNLRNMIPFPGGKESTTTTPSPPPPSSAVMATRASLSLIPNLPTVLIVGGGDGTGGIVSQARALAARLDADAISTTGAACYQMVVVCGNNEEAQETLKGLEEEGKGGGKGSGVSVTVKGFVENMDEFMRASDVLVTKAGPGTIAEASICGLPCVLSSYLPGQEEGNIPFVKEAGFGSYSGDPEEIADTVSGWLSSPDRLAAMKENALRAARPTATVDIARDLGEMLFARDLSR